MPLLSLTTLRRHYFGERWLRVGLASIGSTPPIKDLGYGLKCVLSSGVGWSGRTSSHAYMCERCRSVGVPYRSEEKVHYGRLVHTTADQGPRVRNNKVTVDNQTIMEGARKLEVG